MKQEPGRRQPGIPGLQAGEDVKSEKRCASRNRYTKNSYYKLSEGERIRRCRAGLVISRYAIQDWDLEGNESATLDEVPFEDGLVLADMNYLNKSHEI